MALSYKQFLAKRGPAGQTSSAANAAAWRRTQQPKAPAAPKVAAPAAPTPPNASFTPGALDVAGSQNKGQLDFGYNTGQNRMNMDYQQAIAELDAQQPQLDHSRDLGYQGADNSAAARGLFNSGIRQEARTEVGANYDQAVRDMARRRLDLTNRHQLDMDTATGQYNLDSSNNMIDSNIRQKNAWEEANPIVTPPAPQASLPKPAVKYKDWLKGRTSTAATAAAWRKQYGGNQ